MTQAADSTKNEDTTGEYSASISGAALVPLDSNYGITLVRESAGVFTATVASGHRLQVVQATAGSGVIGCFGVTRTDATTYVVTCFTITLASPAVSAAADPASINLRTFTPLPA